MAGGLATTTTVCRVDLWRMGQCRPGDSILFKRISWESALAVRRRTEKFVEQIQDAVSGRLDASQVEPLDINVGEEWNETILHEIPADEQKGTVQVKFRQVSDEKMCPIHC
jgi:urea carboxylase